MKKMIILAATVATVLFAQADDNYFYWMLTETPSNPDNSFNPAWSGQYYASVKVAGTDNYLTFGNDVSGLDTVTAVANERYQVNLAGYGTGSSFIIELWAEGATEESYATGSLAYSDLYNSGFISNGSEKFNVMAISGSNFHAVPEPTSGMMMLLGAMLLGLKRKKLV